VRDREQLGLGQKQIAAAMGVSVARVSQIEHGKVTSFEVIAATSRPSEAGWISWPTSATGPSGCPSATPRPPRDNHQAIASLARRPT
jgi:hypothetical protein